VLIGVTDGTSGAGCTGSIIGASQILTAAHCTYKAAGLSWPVSGYTISAGIVAVGSGADHTRLQQRTSVAVRVHPGYRPTSPVDDVAVITVSPAFDLSGTAVRAIPVAGIGDAPGPGAPVRIYGWGQTTPGAVDGHEHYLDQTVLHETQCYDGVPSALCAVTPGGTACPGDSGAGITTLDGRLRLVAVHNLGIGGNCTAGVRNGNTDVTTHEIADWLAGSDSPPLAPRGMSKPDISGQPYAGGVLTCTAAGWAAATSLASRFIDSATFQVLQEGPASYVLRDSDVGRDVACISVAAGAGGTTQWRTGSYRIQPPLSPGLSLSIAANGALQATTAVSVALPLTLSLATTTGVAVKRLQFTADRPPATVLPVPAGRYRACLSSPRTGISAAAGVCQDWTRNGVASALIEHRSTKRVRKHRFAVTMAASRGLAGRRVKIEWRIGRCSSGCSPRVYRRTVFLRAKSVYTSPSIKKHRFVKLYIKLPRVHRDGVLYRAQNVFVRVGRR
jgi:Trypsin